MKKLALIISALVLSGCGGVQSPASLADSDKDLIVTMNENCHKDGAHWSIDRGSSGSVVAAGATGAMSYKCNPKHPTEFTLGRSQGGGLKHDSSFFDLFAGELFK